ncbi:hypothetical protein GOV04_02610 [Candidatus Woesearchaeota archaeon]|nr:hypothetical protein [Candidatus Woesearchaeota archaeon]
MNVRQAITGMDLQELKKVEFDLQTGGNHMKQLIQKRIVDYETRNSFCAVCQKPLFREYSYTLTFGPPDLMKKASFCAMDCLDYFLIQVKKLSKQREEY